MLVSALAFVLITSHPAVAQPAKPLVKAAQTEGKANAATAPLSNVAVRLGCTAYPDGRVGECEVLHETRPGLGFGEAALALMNGATLEHDAGASGDRPHRFERTIQFTP
ncbi:hypothetical protein [Brevundimonas sp. PAMC22021]|uniref:hypothetical protein n=1 Tax=Brevundimonas sp. PAMC22021 TaxID=2861285 RepID=UPI001C6326DC|nr:hypothetical protein [Brevundimonas sp. PAMC22021]QYF87100.1 hypothetical protein KY493_00825 [Brevundimonas sp. PAMC22021]